MTGFEAGAYDALNVAVAAAKVGGITREGILKGFQEVKDVPSVVYGKITFDPEHAPGGVAPAHSDAS